MAGRLFLWQPTPKAPRLVSYARADESFSDASSRYEQRLNGDLGLHSLQHESGVGAIDFAGQEIALDDAVGRSDRPRLLILANLLDDLFARPRGDRMLDVVDAFSALGLDAFVLPVVHDAGLSPEDRQAYHALLAQSFAGALALGGPDVSPKLYREPNTDAVEPNLKRDRSELSVIESLGRDPSVALVGICRGSQLLAISRGYQLVQDIHKELPGAVGHKDGWHEILFSRDSWLGRTLGTTHAVVRSFHHEAIDPLSAATLHITATTSDGVVEALESADGRLLGFQFHPELMPTTEGRLIMQGIAALVTCSS